MKKNNVEVNYTNMWDYLDSLSQIASAVGTAEVNKVAKVRQGLHSAIDDGIDWYLKKAERAIDRDAKSVNAFEEPLRHMYAGGNPDNMGVPGKRLFNLTKDKKGRGWRVRVQGFADYEPAVSRLSGTSERLSYEGQQKYAGQYPVWEDRMNTILYAFNSNVAGQRMSDSQPWYLVSTPTGYNPNNPKPDQIVGKEGTFFSDKFQHSYTTDSRILNKYLNSRFEITEKQLIADMGPALTSSIEQELQTLRAKSGASFATGKAVKGSRAKTYGANKTQALTGSANTNALGVVAQRVLQNFKRRVKS